MCIRELAGPGCRAKADQTTQKAVDAGEISSEQALSDDYSLVYNDICLSEDALDIHPILPASVGYLLDESLKLYGRIQRLNEQIQNSPVPSH
jgi:hypothetical protein